MWRAIDFKRMIIGEGKNPNDPSIFHKLSLVAVFAWVGLGSDGLSSSCYGPSEVMLSLHGHETLGIFVALMSIVTIILISASYTQIIELFPSGGGGYLVSSKLLSPSLGMVSGSALMIDYVLTITVSIASSVDAFFSFLPISFQPYKLYFGVLLLVLLTILNLRGVKDSVVSLVPIFGVFVVTHLFVILYAFVTHIFGFAEVYQKTTIELHNTVGQMGIFGTLWLLVHAYSMGAGTFTGIEAVSNGVPILKDPKVHTAKVTMRYMAFSLAFTVFGLMMSYIIFDVHFEAGKTLNASLFEKVVSGWDPTYAYIFVIVTMLSEASLLFVAAQTGFLDGPRVLASMAHDKWVPTRFANLSDRLVTQNGVLVMSVAAFLLLIASNGSVAFLVVLYSMNVFIGFCLSQSGMVLHWIKERKNEKKWKSKLLINGAGLMLSASILAAVTIVKFHEGGWVTLLITAIVIIFFANIKREYNRVGKLVVKVNSIMEDIKSVTPVFKNNKQKDLVYKRNGRTAVLLVNGYTGIGIHSLLSIFRLFGETFENFVFVQVGVIDAGVFKSIEDIEELEKKAKYDVNKYVEFMQSNGYYSEGLTFTGLDVDAAIMKSVPNIIERFPASVFFGGQIVFPKDTFISRLLHNYTVFSIQRKLYNLGYEFVILPIKLNRKDKNK